MFLQKQHALYRLRASFGVSFPSFRVLSSPESNPITVCDFLQRRSKSSPFLCSTDLRKECMFFLFFSPFTRPATYGDLFLFFSLVGEPRRSRLQGTEGKSGPEGLSWQEGSPGRPRFPGSFGTARLQRDRRAEGSERRAGKAGE